MPIIIGIVLIAVGGYFLLFQRKKNNAAIMEIQYQKTSTIPEITEQIQAMADIDQNYREMVELKGFAVCENPPKTPFSQKPVAFYTADCYKVSEETVQDRDSNGNVRNRTVKHEDKISDEESAEELLLKDTEGNTIVIETSGLGGKLDLQKSLDRFQPANSYNENNMFMNRNRHFRSYNVGNYGGGYRLLGYKQVEKIFALQSSLYVLGEAYMNCGKLMIGPPRDSSKPFIVTSKSEEEILKSKKQNGMMTLGGGILCVVVGLIAIVMGIQGR